MNKPFLTLSVAAFFALFSHCTVAATSDTPSNTSSANSAVSTSNANSSQAPLPMSTVLANLQAKKLGAIYKVKIEHGNYIAVLVNSQGKKFRVKFNPTTGDLLEPTKDQTGNEISIIDAAKKVEAAGYTNIYKIEIEHDKYEVKAEKAGKKVELKVDAITGNITED